MSFDYKEYSAEIVPGLGRVYFTPNGPYPSITTILGYTSSQEKNSTLDNWRKRVGNSEADRISQNAANRGTNVHLMLERLINGDDPKFNDFPPDHVKIVTSLRLEIKKITKVYGKEVVLYSDNLQIAGRCDLVGEYQGEPAIIDYKTSTRVKTKAEIGDYWVQCAAYLTCHNEMFKTDIKKMVILMGVENKMPLVFKKSLDEVLLDELFVRIANFYHK